MIIFPAIDIKDGKCVRLNQGDFNQVEIMESDPVKVAQDFVAKGAEFLHIVDLDGALEGNVKNLEIIKLIIEAVDIPIQVGGGIRDMIKVDELLSIGVDRVILGTSALLDRDFLRKAIYKYDNRIVVGVDARDELVATSGWIDVSEINYVDFSLELETLGVKTIVFTDISKDGMLDGPNIEQLLKLSRAVDIDIIASGGVSTMGDVLRLREENFYGAIIGKAIYKGKINLEKAIGLAR